MMVGDLLVVRLGCNPSTGFDWHVKDSGNGTLEQVGPYAFEQETWLKDRVGAPGVAVYRFRARRCGSGRLKLAYYQPFDPGPPPLYTFVVDIVVTPCSGLGSTM